MLSKRESATCNRCGELVVTDFKRGRIICTSCGLIKEDRFIDPTSEYRFFMENTSMRNDPRRVGNMVNYHLDSQIDLIDINEGRNNYHNYATQTTTDKQYANAIRNIKRYCDFLDLRESVIRQVEEIYYEVQDKPELKGKRLENIVAGCIFLACKRNHVNVQPTALEPLIGCSQSKILKVAKVILKHIPPIKVSPAEYVELFCSKLQVPGDLVTEMVEVCHEIDKWDFFQKMLPKPRSIAAAVIAYCLGRQPPSQRRSVQDIKEAAGIKTDTTVIKYVKILNEKQDLLDAKLHPRLQGQSTTGTDNQSRN